MVIGENMYGRTCYTEIPSVLEVVGLWLAGVFISF